MVSDKHQNSELKIPITDEFKILDKIDMNELPKLSRGLYFYGHWHPKYTTLKFDNAMGQAWKMSNVIDQYLRFKLKYPKNIQIHDGKLRVTYNSLNIWIWDEFALATQKNIDIYVNSGLMFGEITLEKNAIILKNKINDLWPEPEDVDDNEDYTEYLNVVKQKRLEKLKKQFQEEKKEHEDKKKIIQLEYNAKEWLIKHDISIDNVIYYNYIDMFIFGWRQLLTDKEKEVLIKQLKGFPYKYELK